MLNQRVNSKTKKNIWVITTVSGMERSAFRRRLGAPCTWGVSVQGLDAAYKPLWTLISWQNASRLGPWLAPLHGEIYQNKLENTRFSMILFCNIRAKFQFGRCDGVLGTFFCLISQLALGHEIVPLEMTTFSHGTQGVWYIRVYFPSCLFPSVFISLRVVFHGIL